MFHARVSLSETEASLSQDGVCTHTRRPATAKLLCRMVSHRVWNSLPTTLRQTTSCAQFSRRLKAQPWHRNTLRVFTCLPWTNIRILTIFFHNLLEVVDFVTRFQPFFSVYTYISLYYTTLVDCASIQRLKAASVFNKVSCQSVHNAGCKPTAHRLNTSTPQPGVASSSWPVPSLPLLTYWLACLLIT